jgi:hypothetical protein
MSGLIGKTSIVKQMAEAIWNIPEGTDVSVRFFHNGNYPLDLDGVVVTAVDDTFAVKWMHEGVKTCKIITVHIADYPCSSTTE